MAAAKNTVLDIEQIVKEWALDMFKITKNKEQSRLKLEELMFTVNWNKIKITHKIPEYNDKLTSPEPVSQVLFKTTFYNNTDQDQEYSFKTERSTRSTCEVEIERGVCFGENLGLSLKLPNEVIEIGCGFSRELSVTNTVTETFEKELIWSVDSQVKVPAKHKTTASLIMIENEFGGKFSVKTKVSGKVVVSITNPRDNNAFVKSIEGDIAEIVRNEICKTGLQGIQVDKQVVSYNTKGNCRMRYGIEQSINLNQEQL